MNLPHPSHAPLSRRGDASTHVQIAGTRHTILASLLLAVLAVLAVLGVVGCSGGGGGPTPGLDEGVSLSGDWNVTRTIETSVGVGCDPVGTIGPLRIPFVHRAEAGEVEATSGGRVYLGTLVGLRVVFVRTTPPLEDQETDEFDVTFDARGTGFGGTYRRENSDCKETGVTAGTKGSPAAPPACCQAPPAATFTVDLPLVGEPPHDPGENWPRPKVWAGHPEARADSIEVPNGRPIYALIVSGYANNAWLDELMVYNFATHLMGQGAYVHYAWWNNLLAPYMERPLHHDQSYPGDVIVDTAGAYEKFSTLARAHDKATPGEDYQFVADAKRFLAAVRENNPRALIVVVGHSMGGGAVVHLGSPWTAPGDPPMPVIDILAPLDPTNNRNFPFGGGTALYNPPPGFPSTAPAYLNWTRWRGSRASFAGFKARNILCQPVGNWVYDLKDAPWFPCLQGPFFDASAPALRFGKKIINLHHRWQTEYLFPYDYSESIEFGHDKPPGGDTSQARVPTQSKGFDEARGQGWPFGIHFECCPIGRGIGWPADGHGEIIGWRGPITVIPPQAPQPLGVRSRTSPQCEPRGGCVAPTWPARSSTLFRGVFSWDNGNSTGTQPPGRVALLKDLETADPKTWPHRPTNPDLCLVSPGLIDRFEKLNRAPIAVAGENQLVLSRADTAEVFLDGSLSSDPDRKDALTYRWDWATGFATGKAVGVTLPLGANCITLTVTDPSGHIDKEKVCVTVSRPVW